jgi:hypothetical protein
VDLLLVFRRSAQPGKQGAFVAVVEKVRRVDIQGSRQAVDGFHGRFLDPSLDVGYVAAVDACAIGGVLLGHPAEHADIADPGTEGLEMQRERLLFWLVAFALCHGV